MMCAMAGLDRELRSTEASCINLRCYDCHGVIMNVFRAGQKSTLIIEAPDGPEERYSPAISDEMEMEDGVNVIEPYSSVESERRSEICSDEGGCIVEDGVPIQEMNPALPTVVLDCANIGWEYGMGHFSVHGLMLVYEYLENFEINVVGFIPASYVRKRPIGGGKGNARMETEELDILNTLVGLRKMTVVPAGDHDDIYILTFARQCKGFVLSNDFYADHLRSLTDRTVRRYTEDWLKEMRCSYTFVGDQLMLNPSSSLVTVLQDFRRVVPEDMNLAEGDGEYEILGGVSTGSGEGFTDSYF